MGWVHASERLSLLHLGKASRGNAKVKTGIGKSDLPGLQGGPRKRDLVIYDKVRASRLYPDHVRFCERPVVQSRRPTHPGVLNLENSAEEVRTQIVGHRRWLRNEAKSRQQIGG